MMFETLHAPESQSNPQDIQQTKALMDVLGIYLLVIFLVSIRLDETKCLRDWFLDSWFGNSTNIDLGYNIFGSELMRFETLHAPESGNNPQDIQQTKTLMEILGIYAVVNQDLC